MSALLHVCISVLLLSGCGFSPMYATGAQGRITQRIAVTATAADAQERRTAEQFKAALEDSLSPEGAQQADYRLLADVNVTQTPTDVSPDGTISRYNVTVSAGLKLTRVDSGKQLYQGNARYTASYSNVTNAFYSTYAASQDARKRAAEALAQEVRLRLAGFFAQGEEK